jgi:hypothetical protein
VADEQEGPENVLGIDTTILGVIDDAVSIGDAERRILYWNAAGHHRSCSGMAPHLGRLSYLAPMNSAPHSTVAAQEGLFGVLYAIRRGLDPRWYPRDAVPLGPTRSR